MFSDEYGLTQAVLDGLKTMTRRIVTYPLKFRGVNVAGYFVCKRPSGEVTEICMYDEDERMIDGGTNEDLFLAIAALRDDTSANQYWVFDQDFLPHYKKGDFTIGHFNRCSCYCHVASVKELIEHFK